MPAPLAGRLNLRDGLRQLLVETANTDVNAQNAVPDWLIEDIEDLAEGGGL